MSALPYLCREADAGEGVMYVFYVKQCDLPAIAQPDRFGMPLLLACNMHLALLAHLNQFNLKLTAHEEQVIEFLQHHACISLAAKVNVDIGQGLAA